MDVSGSKYCLFADTLYSIHFFVFDMFGTSYLCLVQIQCSCAVWFVHRLLFWKAQADAWALQCAVKPKVTYNYWLVRGNPCFKRSKILRDFFFTWRTYKSLLYGYFLCQYTFYNISSKHIKIVSVGNYLKHQVYIWSDLVKSVKRQQ